MKVYLVRGKAYTQSGRLVVDNVLRVFSNKDNAKNFIKENWPAVRYETNDDEGEYYTFGPIPEEQFDWIAKYFIEEWNVEDL